VYIINKDDHMPLSVYVYPDHRLRFFIICTLAAFDDIRCSCLTNVTIYNNAIKCIKHFQLVQVFTVHLSLVTKELRNVDQTLRQMTALSVFRSYATLFLFLLGGLFYIHVQLSRWFHVRVLFAR